MTPAIGRLAWVNGHWNAIISMASLTGPGTYEW